MVVSTGVGANFLTGGEGIANERWAVCPSVVVCLEFDHTLPVGDSVGRPGQDGMSAEVDERRVDEGGLLTRCVLLMSLLAIRMV